MFTGLERSLKNYILQFKQIPAFQDNYIWLIECGNAAWVVDPGDWAPVIDVLEKNHYTLAGRIITVIMSGGLMDCCHGRNLRTR